MSENHSISGTEDRYARQIGLKQIGKRGQERLLLSSVLLVGCGALGTKLADTLVRAGIGRLLIVDRDILELNNLQRQMLFDEEDVAAGLPKAEAVVRKLRRINSTIEIEGRIVDVTPRNIEALIGEASLVLDATDNLETRYLINDACVKLGRPWIYGGVIGTTGMSMNVLPGDGPCLRCVFPTPPPIGSLPTCETQGILGPMPSIIAAIQATEAIKILIGAEPSRSLLSIDVWSRSFEQVNVQRDLECPACGRHQFDFLETRETAWVSSLCGRNAIQITPARETFLSLEQLAEDLASVARVSFNGFLLQCKVEDQELILFPDGRAIVKGTTDEAVARTLYSKYVGG
jgi:adenylyltransferase/sulfurtransferase